MFLRKPRYLSRLKEQADAYSIFINADYLSASLSKPEPNHGFAGITEFIGLPSDPIHEESDEGF